MLILPILSIILFSSIFLLNVSTKLAFCSLLFILSALSANCITALYGRRNAVNIIMIGLFVNILLVWKNISPALLSYANYPKSFLAASFTAVFISIYMSILLYDKLRFKFSFYISNIISLLLATIIDSSIVISSLYFLGKASLEVALILYLKDIVFKLSYISIISLGLLVLEPGRRISYQNQI